MGMAWNMLKPLCPGPKIAGIYGCSSPKCGRYQNVSNGLSKLRNYPQKWMAGPPWVLKKLTHPKISRSWHVSPVETKEKPRPLSVAWCDQVVYIPCRIFFHISRESREARNHQKPFQWEYGLKIMMFLSSFPFSILAPEFLNPSTSQPQHGVQIPPFRNPLIKWQFQCPAMYRMSARYVWRHRLPGNFQCKKKLIKSHGSQLD